MRSFKYRTVSTRYWGKRYSPRTQNYGTLKETAKTKIFGHPIETITWSIHAMSMGYNTHCKQRFTRTAIGSLQTLKEIARKKIV